MTTDTLFRLHRFIWFPTPRRQKGAFWIVVILVVALSGVGIKAIVSTKWYGEIQYPQPLYTVLTAAFFAANVWIMHRKASVTYILSRSAWLPSSVTVLLLSTLLVIVISVRFGAGDDAIDWPKVVFAAEVALLLILMAGSVWVGEQPELSRIGTAAARLREIRLEIDEDRYGRSAEDRGRAWRELSSLANDMVDTSDQACAFYSDEGETRRRFVQLHEMAQKFHGYLDGKPSDILKRELFEGDDLKTMWDDLLENDLVRRGE